MKDPERPKRPESAWLKFLKQFRKENTKLEAKTVMSTAATKWKAMSSTEKAPFETPALAEKEVYRKAMDEYIASGKKDAWLRDPAKPKRPLNAFFRYAAEYREANSQLKVAEATKQAKAGWDKLTEAQKAPYVQKYEEEKKTYKVALEEYAASGKELEWQTKVGITEKLAKKQAVDEEKKAKKAAIAAKKKEQAEKQKAKKAAAKEKAKALLAKKKEKEAAQKAAAKANATKDKEKEQAAKAKAKAKAAAK